MDSRLDVCVNGGELALCGCRPAVLPPRYRLCGLAVVQSSSRADAADPNVSKRLPPGSDIDNDPDIITKNGALVVKDIIHR
jgi:hypothetical protein